MAKRTNNRRHGELDLPMDAVESLTEQVERAFTSVARRVVYERFMKRSSSMRLFGGARAKVGDILVKVELRRVSIVTKDPSVRHIGGSK
jgi:hypothetical protein